MKFKCRLCKKTHNRDMREKMSKYFKSKRGYLTWCEKFGKYTYMKPVTEDKKQEG